MNRPTPYTQLQSDLEVLGRFYIGFQLRMRVGNWFVAKKAAIECRWRGRARIIAYKTKKVSVNPLHLRYPRSI